MNVWNFVRFWRTFERMGFVSSVFGVPMNVRISSFFDVPVIVWFRELFAYLRTDAFPQLFGVTVNVCGFVSSVFDVPVIV